MKSFPEILTIPESSFCVLWVFPGFRGTGLPILQKVINPKLPWYVILQNFMQNFTKDDYSWSRPNKKYMPNFYLPSAYSEAIANIAIAVDSSGSVTDAEFSYFIAEIGSIQETVRPEEILVIDFDTEVQSVQKLTLDSSELNSLMFTGRGGTNILPLFTWAKENEPVVLLIFTDGYFRVPPKEDFPDCPIIWLINDNDHFTAPKGEVITYDLDIEG